MSRADTPNQQRLTQGNINAPENLLQLENEALLATEQVMSRNIPWDALRSATMIEAKDLELIRLYDKAPLETKKNLLDKDGEEYARLFLHLITNIGKEETLQYLLSLVDEILTADENRANLFIRLRDSKNLPISFSPFFRLLNLSDDPDWFLTSKTCRVLSILLLKSPTAPDEDVQQLVRWINKQLRNKTGYLEVSNALHTLQTLLRKDHFRLIVFREDGLDTLNGVLRAQNSNFQLLYETTYCLWLLTYNKEISGKFSKSSTVIHKLVEIVRTIGKEKVIRMAIAALRNVIDKSPTNNEQMIEANLLKEVEKLLAKKWADEDIVNDLEVLRDALQKNVAELSSFDKYKQELVSGDLEWSPVHRSEKFWRENVHRFEEKQNHALSILVGLLKAENSSPKVLAVACFDIGEFVRFHPRGRILIGNSGAKEQVMKLMFHQDPEVQKEALLCLQKLMVHNWEYLSR